jgi:hypothetical protein
MAAELSAAASMRPSLERVARRSATEALGVSSRQSPPGGTIVFREPKASSRMRIEAELILKEYFGARICGRGGLRC